jgi:SpoVK/Ycf46/Vps4 family AAA+-type ATPase
MLTVNRRVTKFLKFLLRRLQHHVHLLPPNVVDVAAIVDLYVGKLNRAADLTTAHAAASLAALRASASEAESFVREVYMIALREAVAEIEAVPASREAERREAQGTPRQLQQRHVDAALQALLLRHGLSLKDVVQQDDAPAPSESAAATSILSSGGFEWSGGFVTGI